MRLPKLLFTLVITLNNLSICKSRANIFALVFAVCAALGASSAFAADPANDRMAVEQNGASQAPAPVEGQVTANGEAIPQRSKGEEALLTMALQELKANNLAEAINNLAQLKDAFPDNDDYLLLYRTALRKKNSSDGDSQKWYAYERGLDYKAAHPQADANDPDYLSARTAPGAQAMKVPAPPRINQLKKATWVVLTTGKHRSPNNGRRVAKPADAE